MANARDVAASSAEVAKLLPSPIIVLIEVIESRFVCVSVETAATSVIVAADTPAIKSSSVSILVAETIPNKADPVTASAVLTDTEPKF